MFNDSTTDDYIAEAEAIGADADEAEVVGYAIHGLRESGFDFSAEGGFVAQYRAAMYQCDPSRDESWRDVVGAVLLAVRAYWEEAVFIAAVGALLIVLGGGVVAVGASITAAGGMISSAIGGILSADAIISFVSASLAGAVVLMFGDDYAILLNAIATDTDCAVWYDLSEPTSTKARVTTIHNQLACEGLPEDTRARLEASLEVLDYTGLIPAPTCAFDKVLSVGLASVSDIINFNAAVAEEAGTTTSADTKELPIALIVGGVVVGGGAAALMSGPIVLTGIATGLVAGIVGWLRS